MNFKKSSIFIRVIAFWLVVLSVVYVLCDIFEYKIDRGSQSLQTYYSLEDDTVDAIFLGTSGVDRYYNSAKGFEEYGVTGFNYSSEGFASWLALPMLKDALKTQSPKVIVIDMRLFTVKYKGTVPDYEVRARRIIDALNFFSPTRFEAINRTYEVIQENKPKPKNEKEEKQDKNKGLEYYLSFVFSFIKYHSRWEKTADNMTAEEKKNVDGFTFTQIGNPKNEHMSFYLTKAFSLRKMSEVPQKVKTDKREKLDKVCEKYLLELLDYLDKNIDAEILFLDTPHYHTEESMARTNTLCDILDERNYGYLVMEVDEEIYDGKNDFYNEGHVNFYGAEKFTEGFARYLKETYNLPDRREDEKCKDDWFGPYDVIKKQIAKWEEK